jgi:hypothetical protein
MLQRYSTDNIYCRYLTVDLNEVRPFRLCNGRLSSYLEKNFDLKKLPHDIKLKDLIFDQSFTPSLLLRISDEDLKECEFRLIMEPDYHPSNKIKSIEKYQHLFDYDEGQSVVRSKRADLEQLVATKEQDFRPYKSYFAYWKCYQLIDTLERVSGVDKFNNKENTKKIINESLIRRQKYWSGHISDVFDLISEFKTMSNYVHTALSCNYSDFDVAEFIASKNKVSHDFFFSGMEAILELYNDWDGKLFSGSHYLINKCKENLVIDVYGLFLIGIAIGIDDARIFDRFTIKDRQPRAWAELKNVLKFPSTSYKNTFTRFLPYYWDDIKKSLKVNDSIALYGKLIKIEPASLWIRAFYHLHNRLSSNIKGTHGIVFESQRELDNFLVMTLRTESILRFVSKHYVSDAYELDAKSLIVSLAKSGVELRYKKILNIVVSNWQLTSLRNSPAEIYKPINDIVKPCALSKVDFHLVKVILKFFVSRNYFAHHHYKDDEFSNFSSLYSSEVLRSSLYTVCFFVSELS